MNGRILDIKTNKAVQYPTIELYKSNTLLQTVKGDKKGNFMLLIHGPKLYTDTITLIVYSESYSGALVEKVQLRKENSKITIKIPKEGIRPSIPEIDDSEVRSGMLWTGRVLD